MGKILCNKPEKGQVKLVISIICNKIIEKHESKSDFKQQLMKRIKKRVNIDQFLNSKYAKKS